MLHPLHVEEIELLALGKNQMRKCINLTFFYPKSSLFRHLLSISTLGQAIFRQSLSCQAI